MKFFKQLFLLTLCTSVLPATSQTQQYTRDLNIIVEKNGSNLLNPWTGGMNSMQFSRIDLDMDGTEDLFCFDRTSYKITTYLNNGASSDAHTYAPDYEPLFPKIRDWALLVDYNMDGKRDIFTAGVGGISVYKNISTVSGGLEFEAIPLPNGVIHEMALGNFINLYVTSVDIPAILDVDNDGDIDVLTFGQFGGRMEYHKNLSMELYGHSDSLTFELYNSCWGNFSEDNSTCIMYLEDTCSNVGVPNPQLDVVNEHRSGARHTGSSTLALDMTGDGVKELLIGDISCTRLIGLYNDGPTVNMATSMVSQDSVFPTYDVSIDQWIFPAGYYEDIDNDGVRDLLVSPNSYNQSEDKQSVLLYRNIGNDSVTNFSYTHDDFLQRDMIEVGTGSVPQYFDYNNDGLLDLFIANIGYFDRASNDYIPSIALYENIGHDTLPAFRWVTDDYANISTMGFGSSIVPDFADLDGDGDKDMMVGDGAGQLHYFENIASTGANANFVLSTPYYEDNTSTAIDVGHHAIPRFVDLDRDGDYDMIIGKKIGSLTYYENVGTTTSPSFEKQTDDLGNVNVKTIFDPGGYSCPTIFDFNGSYQLMVGSNSGTLWLYDDIDGNLNGTFNLIDSTAYDLYPGMRSTPCMVDLSDDDYPELTVGNYGGGLWFFDGYQDSAIVIHENPLNNIKVFPVPAQNSITVELPTNTNQVHYNMLDVSGRLVLRGEIRGRRQHIDLTTLKGGSYYLEMNDGVNRITKKIILQ